MSCTAACNSGTETVSYRTSYRTIACTLHSRNTRAVKAVRQAEFVLSQGGERQPPRGVAPETQVQVLAQEHLAAVAVHVGVKELGAAKCEGLR